MNRDEIDGLLQQPLDPGLVRRDRIGNRPAMDYIPGATIIAQANRIFGWDGWSYEVRAIDELPMAQVPAQGAQGGEQRPAARPAYIARVAVHVGAVAREDVGIHTAANASPESRETAIKGAVTDALKRALRTFGAPFGLELYDAPMPDGASPPPKQPAGPAEPTLADMVAAVEAHADLDIDTVSTWAIAEMGFDDQSARNAWLLGRIKSEGVDATVNAAMAWARS